MFRLTNLEHMFIFAHFPFLGIFASKKLASDWVEIVLYCKGTIIFFYLP